MIRPRGDDPGDGYVGGWGGFLAELAYARITAWARARDARRPRVRAAVPVLSIGNLAAGGSGKTPFAAWTARRLLAAGHRVAIVARPVGGPVPGAEGDEIALLRALVPGATVVAARSKSDGAAAAARDLAAGGPGGVVVVDDAFSHHRLERDLDVVLLDAARPLGNGHLLPYGPLREPPTALARAGALVLSRADRLDADALAKTHAALARLAPGVPQAAGRLAPTGLVRADDGTPVTLPGGAAVVCVSGLARPGELGRSARALGLTVVAERAFADHHRFGAGEWREALAVAERNGARVVVSAKDAMRLDRARRAGALVLEVTWEWTGAGGAAVAAAIDRAAGKGNP